MHRTVAAMIAAGVLGASGAIAGDNPTSTSDLTGGWRLHAEGSRFLHPQSAPKDLVWGILFDTGHVRWNLVIIPQAGPPTFESFENDANSAKEAGIDGVPCFIFGGSLIVTGAQSPEYLASAIERTAGRHTRPRA